MILIQGDKIRLNEGIKWLDSKDPQWREKITRRIDVRSKNNCILAQVFGSFEVGRKILGENTHLPIYSREKICGFAPWPHESYGELNALWEKELRNYWNKHE